jgi:hypothetical protein
MPENHDPTWIAKTGRGKHPSMVSPAMLYSDGSVIAPDKSESVGQQHPGCQEENPFRRDSAECFLAALAGLTNRQSSAPDRR